MTDTLYLDANFVKAQVAKLIEAYPELKEDESLRADMLEAETDVKRIVERCLSERQEAEMMAGALDARIVTMCARKGRFQAKSRAMKELIRSLLKAARLDRLQLPEATLSIVSAKSSVGIEELADLPQGFYRTIREPDKGAIKTALEAGQDVPGAFLVLGEEGLMIRPK